MGDCFAERAALVAEPSVELWELELRRLLAGNRVLRIFELGDAREYVDSLLAESSDSAFADFCFRQALRRVVGEWRPEPYGSRSSMSCMLDLISEYTPHEGFVRISELCGGHGRIDDHQINDSWYPAPVDLHLKALIALHSFLPIPPLEGLKDPAFASYVRLLRRHLTRVDYAGYSALRLLDLGMANSGDEELAAHLCRSQRSLLDFVTFVITAGIDDRIGEFLEPIYWEILRREGEYGLWFHRALQGVNAHLENRRKGPVIILEENREVDLSLPAHDEILLARYMTARHQWESQEGFEKARLVVEYVEGQNQCGA